MGETLPGPNGLSAQRDSRFNLESSSGSLLHLGVANLLVIHSYLLYTQSLFNKLLPDLGALIICLSSQMSYSSCQNQKGTFMSISLRH